MASATVPAYLQGTGTRYYKHSGHITVDGVLLGLATGVFGGGLLAVLYAYLLQWVPWAILRLMLPLGFGAALGFAPAALMRARKVRSLPHGLAVTAICALASFYVSWCYWIYLLMAQAEQETTLLHFLGLLLQPNVTWNIASAIASEGAWSLKSSGVVKGWALWVVWFSEAAAVLGGAIMAARRQLWRNAFCEACNDWCNTENSCACVGPVPAQDLKDRLEARDYQFVASNLLKPDENFAFYRLDLHRCTCQQTQTLSAVWVAVKADGTRDEKVVVDKLLLAGHEAEALRQLAAREKNAA